MTPKKRLSTKITAAGLAFLQAFFPVMSACAGIQNITALPDLGSNNAEITHSVNPDSVAHGLSEVGSTLNGNSHLGDAFSQLSLNMTESAVNSYLAQYGNASLSFDTEGTGEGKMLFPLFDSQENLLFTQLGASRNERFTSNSGLGYRRFSGPWMLGFNTFYDYDFTGHNKRYSLGAEVATDYFSLSYNQYLPLSDWHQAYDRQYQDFDERPARGYDLTARGYLPAYPALGGKLSYERYYGDNVILAGSNDMKKNPYSLSFGLDYSPVPLLNISATHKAGSVTDNQLALSLNYRFGVPLADQLNSNLLPLTRTLQGSRYNFVDRNNLITLQYRKQELIRVHLPESVSGKGGETMALDARVKSKYGLQKIEWSAPDFITHGGTIESKNQHSVYLHLPPYRAGEKSEYTLTALATDVHGNTGRASTLISVEKPSLEFAAMDVVKDLAIAGQEKNEVRIRLTDKEKSNIANKKVFFSSTQNAKVEPESVQTDHEGVAVVQVSSKTAGQFPVYAKLENGNSIQRSVIFVANKKQFALMLTAKQKHGIVANGVEEHVVSAVARDINGNVVPDISFELNADNGAVLKKNKITTDKNGVAEFRVTNTHAGKTTVKAKSENAEGQIELFFSGDPATAVVRNFYADPQHNNAAADGQSENRMIAEVRDANNNPVPEVTVDFFAKDKEIIIKNKKSKTDANGNAFVYLSSTLNGEYIIAASINNITLEGKTYFILNPKTLRFDYVNVDKRQAIADGIDSIYLKFRVINDNGAPVSNTQVDLSSNSQSIIFSSSTVFTSLDGTGEAYIYSNTAEDDVKIHTTLINGHKASTDSLKFTQNKKNAQLLIISEKQNSEANGRDKNELKIQVVDKNSMIPLRNAEISIVTNPSIILDCEKLSTDNDGYATISIASYKAGKFSLSLINSTNQIPLGKVETTFIFDHSTASFQLITLDKESVVADGISKQQISVHIHDIHGNPANDVVVTSHSMDEGVQAQTYAVTDVNGVATLSVTSTIAGYKTIKLTTQNIATNPVTQAIHFTTDLQNLRLTGISVSSETLLVNSNTYLKGKIEDGNGNPAEYFLLNAVLTADNETESFSGVTDINGFFNIKISTQKAGNYHLQVKYGGKTEALTHELTFRPDYNSATIRSLVTLKDDAIARHPVECNMVKAIVKDAFDNPVPKIIPSVEITTHNGYITSITPSNSSGETIISVKANTPGKVALNVFATNESPKNSVVNFKFDTDSLFFTQIHKSKNVIVANGIDSTDITFKVVDKYGNPSTSLDGCAIFQERKIPFKTNNNGEGLINLTSLKWIKAGEVRIILENYSYASVQTTVDFIGDKSTAKVTFILDEEHIPHPDFKDKGKLIAVATDINKNPVCNLKIDSDSSDTNLWAGPDSALTDQNGNAIFYYWGGGGNLTKYFTYYKNNASVQTTAKVKFISR